MSDLTLLSKISNEAINDNLKKRFENAEIYVRLAHGVRKHTGSSINGLSIDLHWACAGLCQPLSRL